MSRGLLIAIGLAGAAALIIPLILLSGRSDSLDWQKDYDSALATAKARNQMVVAYLYTDWCTYCKKMEAETFTSDQVKGEAGRYVWLKLNPERDEYGARLKQQYGVTGYPTMLLLDSGGALLDQIVGFMPAAPFLQALAGIATRVSSLDALKEQSKQQPVSVEARYALAEKYLELKNFSLAADGFARVIQTDPDNKHAKTELSYYHLAVSLASMNEHAKAQEQLDLLLGKFPTGKLAAEATILKGQIFYRQNDVPAARDEFEQFLVKYPTHEKTSLVRRMIQEIGPDLPLSAAH
ncbi:MAG: outer membrane protein assembly factor BamD [Acidobacteria bacterium]|nr:MAG: outer membrane protein assembly factor BamD [Acidobacteriota bacterium]